MRALATIAAIGLVTSAALAQPDGWQKRGDRWERRPTGQGPVSKPIDQGLCRHAPMLAPLPPEQRLDQPGNVRPREDVAAPAIVPPPPADDAAPPSKGSDLVITGSRVKGGSRGSKSAPEPVPPPPPPPPPVPMPEPMAPPPMAEAAPPPASKVAPSAGYSRGVPQPQAGILTAGEHDDLLNPELYANYVRRSDLGQRWQTLPLVDTGRALTVAVTDARGQPLPLADVTLTCADGNTLSLKTLADGTAVFFPGLDRLGSSVQVSVRSDGRLLAVDRRVLIPSAPGTQRVSVTAATLAGRETKFDLMLVLDTTGSMGDEINYLKAELRSILSAVKAAHPGLDMRIGLVFYRDQGDNYVTLTAPFTADLDAAQAMLRQQSAGGGGDYPEAVDVAMNRAVNDFDWRPDAVKSMLWVADAPPHDELVGAAWAAAEVARAKRIQIIPVAASGVAKEAEFVMRAFAATTQSRYLFLTDDSGVGLPHNKPAIDCYLVTKLDALVRRVLDSQISGRRIEPRPDEVIRTVGQYDAGKCTLPAYNWQGED